MKEEIENSATDVLAALLKQLKTMWIVIILLIILLVGTNMAWLWVFQSYDYVSQDGEGYNYFNREVEGDVFNGAESKDKEKGQEQGD
ncbi:hypothetical protein D3Z36_14655 [Lachnospiraceae bacterium]|nr:hypothetical protein [Lachnospiraceae bacterium]